MKEQLNEKKIVNDDPVQLIKTLYFRLKGLNSFDQEAIIELINKIPELKMNTRYSFDKTSIIDLLIQKGDQKILRAAYKKAPLEEQLFVAAAFGWKKTVAHLIKKGADVNAHLPTGETPLYVAAQHGHLACVTELLDAGALVNPQTVLYDLIAKNSHEALRARLRTGVNSNIISPLCAATQGKHHDVMELLLKRNADAQQLSPYGKALEAMSYECTDVLLWSDLNDKSHHYSALHIAAINDDPKALQLLLDNGVSVDHAAQFAIEEEGFLCIPGSVRKHPGSTALHAAATNGSLNAAQFLIDHGAKVNQIAYDRLPYKSFSGSFDDINVGMMPIHLAAQGGKTAVVALLLQEKSLIDFETRRPLLGNIYVGYTLSPIAFALSTKGQAGTVKVLIDHNACLKKWNSYMRSATQNNDLDSMKLLLDHQGKSRRDLALFLEISSAANNLEAVTLLLSYGAVVTEYQLERAKESGYDQLYILLQTANEKRSSPVKQGLFRQHRSEPGASHQDETRATL